MTCVTPKHAEQHRELALLLHDLSWRFARFGPAQVGLDPLPASELTVLRSVLDDPGRSVSDVAHGLQMQTSNVSAAVRSLIERGLLEKRVDTDDRRIALLTPTPRALADREQIEDAIAASITTVLRAISNEHVDALTSAVPAFRALIDQVGAAAPHL